MFPGRFIDPARDPQQVSLYGAQTAVVLRDRAGDLFDLLAVKRYLDTILKAEGLTIGGCYRAFFYEGPGPGVLVHRGTEEKDLSGQDYVFEDGTSVTLHNSTVRWSAFEQDYREILVAAPGHPLSHKLLILHEVAHVINPLERASHGPSYAASFLQIVGRHLAPTYPLLRDEFVAHGVRWAPV